MKTILITGGSEGLGYELARKYARDGHSLILVARNEEKLRKSAQQLKKYYGIDISVIPLDLSEVESAQKLYDVIQKRQITVDILINNAGFGLTGESYRLPMEEEERMVVLQCATVMSLTKLFLKDMVERDEGIILNIASTAAFQPGPYMAGYYAAKAFILNYTRAVAEEVKGTGVYVACYCPGQFDSGFLEKSNSIPTRWIQSVETIASEAIRLMKTRRIVLVPGLLNQLLLLLPETIRMKVIAEIKKPKR